MKQVFFLMQGSDAVQIHNYFRFISTNNSSQQYVLATVMQLVVGQICLPLLGHLCTNTNNDKSLNK